MSHRKEICSEAMVSGNGLEAYAMSQDLGLQTAAEKIIASPLKLGIISDLDDSLYDALPTFIAAVNSQLLLLCPGEAQFTMEELMGSGGRFEECPRLEAVAAKLSLSLLEFLRPIFAPETCYAMSPFAGVAATLHWLESHGLPVAGYLTARRSELHEATAKSLQRHEFPKAPILTFPSKAEFFGKLLPLVPTDTFIIFLEDNVPTALEVHEQHGDRVKVKIVANISNLRFSEELLILGLPRAACSELLADLIQSCLKL